MSQKIIINDFIEGVDTDSDVLRIKRTKLRDSLNTVVVTVDGKGVVRTPIPGFSYEFSFSPGFVPMGAAQYNGILYFLSLNQTTGEGEIGTYPSPNDNCAGGFQHTYKPLQNWTGVVNPLVNPLTPRLDFRTSALLLECPHQVDVEVRDDFDGSVNIYFADWNSPLRVINSGFDQSGNCNNRLYWNGSFPAAVEVFGESQQPIIADITSIPNGGGALQAGNIFFYFRYSTATLNKTSFLGWTGPAQISLDDDGQGVIIDGKPGLTVTAKSVNLHLGTPAMPLDTNFPFIEVAVAYYYNDLTRYALIDERFAINAATGEIDITITGKETVLEFTFDELIKTKNTDDIPKSITQIENQLWMGNLKKRATFDQSLVTWAANIKPHYNDSLQIDDRPFRFGGSKDKFQYKDWNQSYRDVGYFRTEPYAFAIIPVFNSGRKGRPIPIKGGDDFNGGVLYTNNKGIYRFPNCDISNPRTNTITPSGEGKINVLGIQFDTSAAPFNQFINDNVIGFHFARAERRPTLIYQGLVLNAMNTVDFDAQAWWTANTACNVSAEETILSSDMIPLWNMRDPAVGHFEGVFPIRKNFNPQIGSNTMVNASATDYAPIQTAKKVTGKYGIYSMDHFFKKTLNDGLYYVLKTGTMVPLVEGPAFLHYAVVPGQIINPGFIYDTAKTFYDNPNFPQNNGRLYLRNIAQWELTAQGGFKSYFTEGSTGNGNSFLYSRESCSLVFTDNSELLNREMASPHYIAADMTMPGAETIDIDADTNDTVAGFYRRSIISIYNLDPLPASFTPTILANHYDITNEKYYEISDFIPKSVFHAETATKTYYRGDCFLQRTYQKQLQDPRYGPTGDDGQGVLTFNTHGVLQGIVTENAINTDMRFQETGRVYYPETGYTAFQDVIVNILREAEGRNNGYNRTLPADFQYGADLIVLSQEANRFPTRIRFTNKHIHNALADGYRRMAEEDYKDFDFRMGEITAIESLGPHLVSVQESGINFHIINERVALQNSTADDILIGNGDILSQKFNNITDIIGSQNQWSIIKTLAGLTGVDAYKRKVWLLRAGGEFSILSDDKLFRQAIDHVLGLRNPHSDVIEKMGDSPICTEGIHTGYDFKTGNIFYTFVLKTITPGKFIRETLCYNEVMDQYLGRFSFNPNMYFNINNDLFSLDYVNAPVDNQVWRHGVTKDGIGNPNYCVFYGIPNDSMLRWLANENPELTKVFDNLNLTASGHTPVRIRFATEDQVLEYNPFIQNDIAHDGKYMENQWRIPIGTAVTVNNTPNNIYSVKSSMRGKYLDITLTYSTLEQYYIKSSLLYNRLSKR